MGRAGHQNPILLVMPSHAGRHALHEENTARQAWSSGRVWGDRVATKKERRLNQRSGARIFAHR